jgi:hypothetical protein
LSCTVRAAIVYYVLILYISSVRLKNPVARLAAGLFFVLHGGADDVPGRETQQA